jgi:hypothetical protein
LKVMRLLAFIILLSVLGAPAQATTAWEPVNPDTLIDDDIARHSNDPAYLTGITVTQTRFKENGFNWNLIRLTNSAKPDGPLWVVSHDDENAAFESMISALRIYGGTGIAVNSGPKSIRQQRGYGRCGETSAIVTLCDPNRNFSDYSPLFTNAILEQVVPQQPVIALHTNSPGFGGDGQGGYGDVTILDGNAYRDGVIRPRADGAFGIVQPRDLANYDTLALVPYHSITGSPDSQTAACGKALSRAGVHFWAESVGRSDGSLSNIIALNHPDIRYFNAESRREDNLETASARHMLILTAYLRYCR